MSELGRHVARPAPVDVVDLPDGAGARAVCSWVFDAPRAALSSAPVGGGSSAIEWLLNIGVPADYDRTDLDTHAREIAGRLGLQGTGAAMLTAVDVHRTVRAEDGDVVVDATVGVTKPTWAADVDGSHGHRIDGRWEPGTINIVVQVPVALSPAAAVNAVITATEAKAQALQEAGVPGTGTASDAVTVVWPPAVPVEAFAGPRSTWGARIGRAVHAAIRDGLERHP
ncbi:MAG TPA: adenosylcobinamide amidohydrolase [Acidimicrobiales bacterium]|nr:adenosylcobinamide amidohydrolase [Acidimicrobiales bacterium]